MEPTSSARMILFVLLSLLVTKCHSQHAADWMSGNHGIGFRIPGGVNMETAVYDVSQLVKQIKDNIPEITWVLLGISSGAYGDQYTSPHSILTDLNRASTPRQTENVEGLDNWMEIHSGGQLIDFELEKYPERDLFKEIADAFHAEGYKVIAYMASQGPTFLKHGERRAYDYANKSKYVDSVAECKTLTDNVIQDGKCSPSARKWKNYVLEEYGSDDDTTLQTAWAEKILGEYVNKFDGKDGRSYVDAWWFDQGSYMNIPLAHSIIKTASPNALIAFNDGQKVPLMNNNPGLEDFTSGHPTPITQLPPYDDTNEAIIESVESTSDGYFEKDGFYSLGHVFQMTNDNWNHGKLVWNGDKMPKAIDWMSRTLKAHGAWTWNVKRLFWPLTLHPDDIALVKDIIAGMKDTGSPTESTSSSPTTIPTQSPTAGTPTSTPTDNPTQPLTTGTPTSTPTDNPTQPPTTGTPTSTPTGNPTQPPTTGTPTLSPTTKLCTAHKFRKPCTAANCVWDNKSKTCSYPKLCFKYTKKKCEVNDCYWDYVGKTCSSTDPCPTYKKKAKCKKGECVWKADTKECSRPDPCEQYTRMKTCKANECYWHKKTKKCSETNPCLGYKFKNGCKKNNCTWNNKTKKCV